MVLSRMGKGSFKNYLLVYATGMCLYFTMAVLQHVHTHYEIVAFEYCSFNKDIYDGELYIKEIMPRAFLKPKKQALKNVRDNRPIIAVFSYKILTDKKRDPQVNSSQQNTERISPLLVSRQNRFFALESHPLVFP